MYSRLKHMSCLQNDSDTDGGDDNDSDNDKIRKS